MDGAESIDGFPRSARLPGNTAYVVYMSLGDLYLEKERFQDAAVTYEVIRRAKIRTTRRRRCCKSRLSRLTSAAGFPTLVLEGKKGFVERYGMDSPFWQRNPREENAAVEASLKENLNDLAQYYHAEAQSKQEPRRLPGSGQVVSQATGIFPG